MEDSSLLLLHRNQDPTQNLFLTSLDENASEKQVVQVVGLILKGVFADHDGENRDQLKLFSKQKRLNYLIKKKDN